MIRKRKKIAKKRKNPAPQFHNELKELIGKEVTVRFRDQNGFFSITGKLEYGSIKNRFYVINDKSTIVSTIDFNLRFVENIKILSSGNFIDLIPSPYHDYGDFLMFKDVEKFINAQIFVFINKKMYDIEGLPLPFVIGKLKYNKKDKLFYIQSSDHEIQISFVIEAVRWIHSRENELEIEI